MKNIPEPNYTIDSHGNPHPKSMANAVMTTYTVIGEQGNSSGEYTQAAGTLSEAIGAVRRGVFPLCIFRNRPTPYYITEALDGHAVRYYDLRSGNVHAPRSEADRSAGANSQVRLAWPGAYEGCPLTEALIAAPKVSMTVPEEWIAYCRAAGLVRQ